MNVFTENEIMELASEYHNIRKVDSYFKRLQALYYRSNGQSLNNAIKITGCSKGSIAHWTTAYRRGGLDAIRSHYATNHWHLSQEEEETYLNELMGDATEGKFARIAEIQQAFEEMAGVKYKSSSFYKLLKRHDWRKVPKKASEAAMEASKKLKQK
jgi:transposase